jgi:hypothetical protein
MIPKYENGRTNMNLVSDSILDANNQQLVDFAVANIGECLYYTLVLSDDGYDLQCGMIDGYSGWGKDAIELNMGWESAKDFADSQDQDLESLIINYKDKYGCSPDNQELMCEYYKCLDSHELKEVMESQIAWGIDQIQQGKQND